MTDLAQLQRGLLCLMKDRAAPRVDDPYLQRVAESRELAMAREVAIWWRKLGLESYCVFTSRLLKRLGLFDELAESFFCRTAVSPFIEKLGADFLAEQSDHPDSLVASMARFELALVRVKQGDAREYQVDWNSNPESVFQALFQDLELPAAEPERLYRMSISARIPNLVSCTSHARRVVVTA